MSKAPAFQFYPNEWLGSTKIMLMTPAEEGAYIRLLAIEWNDPDCTLPSDDKELSILSRLGEGWFNGGGTVVKGCFKQRGTRLYNERLMQERKKQEEWREKSRRGGIKSGKTRASAQLDSEGCLKGGSQMVGRVVEPKGNTSSSFSSSINNKDIVVSDKPKRTTLADEDFIKALKENVAYQGIDIEREIGKLDAWLLTPKGKGKQRTQGRLLNWLNRIDRPMQSGKDKSW